MPVTDQTPYVVDNKWIVYAKNSMEATMKYRNEKGLTQWPAVRQAKPEDVLKLAPLLAATTRRAA